MSQRWSVTRDDDRAEMLALCIALDLHPDASYERPAERRGVRTPDWLLHLPGDSDVAMEVTHKADDLRYKNLDIDGGTVRAGFNVKISSGRDTDDLYRTLTRKMQDKAEEGQLESVPGAEKWLCIQLDTDAAFDLETLFQPHGTITMAVPSCAIVAVNEHATAMPSLDCLVRKVREFGYDEVWAFTRAALAQGRTLVLRMRGTEERWECFHMVAEWCFENGGVARRWDSSP